MNFNCISLTFNILVTLTTVPVSEISMVIIVTFVTSLGPNSRFHCIR